LLTDTSQSVTIDMQLSSGAMLVSGSPHTSFAVLQGGQSAQISWTIEVRVPGINWVAIVAHTPKGGVEKLLVTIFALPHKTEVFWTPLPP